MLEEKLYKKLTPKYISKLTDLQDEAENALTKDLPVDKYHAIRVRGEIEYIETILDKDFNNQLVNIRTKDILDDI